MKNYIVRKVLNDSEVVKIRQILSICEWVDGLNTGGGSYKIKKNLETFNSEINQIIMNSMDRDLLFHSFTCPKTSNSCIISKIDNGGYYRPHRDSPENGNFSTTVFLNDSDEYDGGELILYIDGEEKKFKLNAGEAITYQTGLMHEVSEVTRGQRIVSVFWTFTHIKDNFMREIYTELLELNQLIDKMISKPLDNKTIEDFNNDPTFICRCLSDKILRKYYDK
jgi:PKHD-type hydroxylase